MIKTWEIETLLKLVEPQTDFKYQWFPGRQIYTRNIWIKLNFLVFPNPYTFQITEVGPLA
jgi:hypothetical protein